MSEPVRITKSATASDLTEALGWLGEEIEKRAREQVREECAEALLEQFIDRSKSYVKFNDTPDDSITWALTNYKATENNAQFRALGAKFDENGVSDEFRLGIRFCIALLKDPEFEL